MLLDSNNFKIKIITVDGNNIKSYDISNKIKGFTNSNFAPVLGQDNLKYKIMFENIEIDKGTNSVNQSIIIQVSFKIDNKFYNPFLFLPIKQGEVNSQEGPGRAMSYQLFENKFNHLWLYFTHSGVNDILSRFTPANNIIETVDYIKEYTPFGNQVTN
tara:strand:+ start:399 stop:872 length:474 start_codon:yes stop_codon:yes gene_type:complete